MNRKYLRPASVTFIALRSCDLYTFKVVREAEEYKYLPVLMRHCHMRDCLCVVEVVFSLL